MDGDGCRAGKSHEVVRDASLSPAESGSTAGGAGRTRLTKLRYEKLIMATGARERFLPSLGWTLPNVMGAGGLQAMVKSGLPIHGKRVVVAGTGPLLLAVAAYLRKHGAEVLMICDQASWVRLSDLPQGCLRNPQDGSGLATQESIGGSSVCDKQLAGCRAGRQLLESVTISREEKSETIACDYLACGFHLVPEYRAAVIAGLRDRKRIRARR